MRRALNVCPACGSRVSQYAAGCAVCGYDMAAARYEREQRPGLELPSIRLPGWLTGNAGIAAVLFLLAAFMPVIGLLLAGFVGFHAHNEGRDTVGTIAIVAGSLAVALLLIPSWQWGLLSLLQ